ncbi:MAG: PPC domain-containing DNA-binding protein [Halanaeroarchaeum sp.]
MHAQEVTPEHTLLVELEYDESLSSELAAIAESTDLESAWVLGTGALREAELAVYDQDEFATESVTVDEPLELPIFTGTITTTAETPDVQVQGVLARPSGQALAGRIESATVFSGTVLVWGFSESLPKERDPATGMDRFSV